MYGYVRELLAEKGGAVYTVPPDATVSQAVRLMNDHGIGALVVVRDRSIVGMFTERDVLRRVVDTARDPNTTRVAAVMTANVIAASPSMRVEQAMRLMTDRRFRHLPVLAGDELIGMVSIGDLNRWVTINQEHEIQKLTDYITGKAPA